MDHHVFVYGTLLRGEVNHHLLRGAEWLGPHRTAPCFTLLRVGAYPGAVRGGGSAIQGEVFRVDTAGLHRLDQLEEYPRLYDRQLIPTAYGRAWCYLYRGRRRDRRVIQGGDWRAFATDPDSYRAAGVRRTRDAKNRPRRPAAAMTQVTASPRAGAEDATHRDTMPTE
jgi:gamma-glutamylaminecyclotransferase